MKRAVFFGVAIAAAVGLGACGGSSSGGSSSPDSVMATFASAVRSGDWTGACAVAVPSQKDACTKALRSLRSEKVTIKDVSYTVSHVGSDTAEVKLRITACEDGHCDASSSNTGELVKQNGNWYVSNSTGAFGNSGDTGNTGNS
jgi:hypothetical protein